jgi:hypothetical protein
MAHPIAARRARQFRLRRHRRIRESCGIVLPTRESAPQPRSRMASALRCMGSRHACMAKRMNRSYRLTNRASTALLSRRTRRLETRGVPPRGRGLTATAFRQKQFRCFATTRPMSIPENAEGGSNPAPQPPHGLLPHRFSRTRIAKSMRVLRRDLRSLAMSQLEAADIGRHCSPPAATRIERDQFRHWRRRRLAPRAVATGAKQDGRLATPAFVAGSQNG